MADLSGGRPTVLSPLRTTDFLCILYNGIEKHDTLFKHKVISILVGRHGYFLISSKKRWIEYYNMRSPHTFFFLIEIEKEWNNILKIFSGTLHGRFFCKVSLCTGSN